MKKERYGTVGLIRPGVCVRGMVGVTIRRGLH